MHALHWVMMKKVDCSLEFADMARTIAPLLAGATHAVLHSPWDDETGWVVTDDTDMKPVAQHDIVVVAKRDAGMSDADFATRLVNAFEVSV